MKKIVTGISLLSMFAFAVGCSDDNTWINEANTGKASFALQNDDYRLTATIDILADDEGNPGAATGDQIVTAEDEASATVDLAPGDYHADMVSWQFFDADGLRGTNVEPNDVAFIEFTPAPFTITAGNTTNVTATFELGDDVVVTITTPPAEGTAGLVLVGDELACDPGCDAGEGEACASVDEGPAFCAITCVTPAEDSVECGAGIDCVEGTGGNICLAG